MRRFAPYVALALLLLPALFVLLLNLGVLPARDRGFNAVLHAPPYAVDPAARAVHDAAYVVDLHADPLLWRRDLLAENTRGQVDVPRLIAGGVDLQVFGVVTHSPKGQNPERNAADTDRLPLLFFATLRPPSAWFDPFGRALAQARELARFAERSDGRLRIVRSRADLDAAPGGVAGLLALEGMHPLRDDPQRLEALFAAGYRMMGPAHFVDTAVAGSAHGLDQHGLTPLGRTLLARMEALGVTVDLAHASIPAFDEVLAQASHPVVVSHTGVQGTCPGPRNLSDEQLRKVAANGGVVGIAYFDHAICDVSVAGIVAALRHAVAVAGIDHVGLGSDFDGAVHTPFDTTGVALITEALLAAGFSRDEVQRVLGGNARRVLEANLPPG